MPNNTLELISVAYTGVLWDHLENVLTDEDSSTHIYEVPKSLHDCGKDKAAFLLVRTLYDITGIDLPGVVEAMDKSDDTRNSYRTLRGPLFCKVRFAPFPSCGSFGGGLQVGFFL
jgi:hypothetical protein